MYNGGEWFKTFVVKNSNIERMIFFLIKKITVCVFVIECWEKIIVHDQKKNTKNVLIN
jgi:hypothetical protein